MKRIATWIAGAAFLAVFGAGAAWAGVEGTSHQTSVGDQGYCSACHMPHKAPSNKRLWPANMSAYEADYGDVGALCYYCHGSGGGAGLTNAWQDNIMTAGTPSQGEFSHGLQVSAIPTGGNGIGTSGLPYVGNLFIECTTCHNVHDDTNRPFLRANIDVICAYCHTDRLIEDAGAYTIGDPLGTWGAANYGSANPGSHPVGTDVQDDESGAGNSPLSFAARVTMAKSATPDNWSLGGHLAGPAGGALAGITCTTCHAPHGVDLDDATPPTAAEAPTVDLLAIEQTSDGTSAGDHGDGDNLAANALCEGCHVEGGAGIYNAGIGGPYAGLNNPNPGGTAYTHPVDDLGAANTSVPNGADFPTGGGSWPVGLQASAGVNMNPAVICESCHTPHPLADEAVITGRITDEYIMAASGTHILRAPEETICGMCHTEAVADHHPVGAYDTARFFAANIGDNDTPLTCGDCHNGAGAHNWVQPSAVGLDPDWLPFNNGRTATDTKVGENSVGASTTCVTCHTADGQPTEHKAPTSHDGDVGADLTGTASLRLRTRGSYQDTGDGSHFLGNTDGANLDYTAGTLVNDKTAAPNDFNASSNTATWTAGGWSRFDTTSGYVNHLVCESCHELEPDKNATGTAMLLHPYSEGTTALGTFAAFCEGCHSARPGGTNPHPMAGDTISRAELASDPLGDLLVTSGRFSRAAAAWTGSVTNPADDAVNCDSCHQPHDTDNDGGTYIYESDDIAAVSAATAPTPDGDPGHPARGSTASGIQDLPFCNQCHNY